jgi:hypothetical protein
MTLGATLARCLQADMQVELRPIGHAAEIRTAAQAAASGPNSAGRRRSVLIRGKVCVRECRVVFRDCGAGTGGGLAA